MQLCLSFPLRKFNVDNKTHSHIMFLSWVFLDKAVLLFFKLHCHFSYSSTGSGLNMGSPVALVVPVLPNFILQVFWLVSAFHIALYRSFSELLWSTSSCLTVTPPCTGSQHFTATDTRSWLNKSTDCFFYRTIYFTSNKTKVHFHDWIMPRILLLVWSM